MNIIKVYEDKLLEFLTKMIGKCEIQYRYDSGIRFLKQMDEDAFVLEIHIHEEYNYVALTNILLPPSMKFKGVSIEIINMLLQVCNETGLMLYVTEITNEAWRNALMKHGGLLDNDGDIFINHQNWKSTNECHKLEFKEFENELILISELEWYSNLKKKCILETKNIFKSWNAKMDIKSIDENLKHIVANKDGIIYFVKFKYPHILTINNLIEDNRLEEYLKIHLSIGGFC